MKKKLLAGLASGFFMFAMVEMANAALISIDDPSFGPGSITKDTNTGFEWLDLTSSLNRSYNEVITQFGTGGDYEGFRYASANEVSTLFSSAGIPDINVEGTAANIIPGTALANLVGPTTFQDVYPEAIGVTGTSASTGSHYCGLLDFYWSGYPNALYSATTNGLVYGDQASFNTAGHWLVRPVPLPGAFWLLGSGVAGLFAMRKKFSKSQKPLP